MRPLFFCSWFYLIKVEKTIWYKDIINPFFLQAFLLQYGYLEKRNVSIVQEWLWQIDNDECYIVEIDDDDDDDDSIDHNDVVSLRIL